MKQKLIKSIHETVKKDPSTPQKPQYMDDRDTTERRDSLYES